jgi:hypothetical protein
MDSAGQAWQSGLDAVTLIGGKGGLRVHTCTVAAQDVEARAGDHVEEVELVACAPRARTRLACVHRAAFSERATALSWARDAPE